MNVTLVLNSIASTVVNLIVLVVIPGAIYATYQKIRHRRTWGELARRCGLQVGDARFIGYSLAIAAGLVLLLLLLPLSVEAFGRPGSAMRPFVGLGLNGTSILMALLYGGIQTGFTEEFLFRGMIAGSLSRRLSVFWADIWQAVIFLIPHLLILAFMPEFGWLLILIFAGTLLAGWLRIRSGSIIGPWLIHASVNVTMCLLIANLVA